MRRTLLCLSLLVTVALAACGGDTSNSSSSASCCLNKSYYSCGSSADATKCFDNADTSGCSRDSSKDKSCE